MSSIFLEDTEAAKAVLAVDNATRCAAYFRDAFRQPPPGTCYMCDKRYANKACLRDHMSVMHLGCQFPCVYFHCAKLFTSRRRRNAHIKTHLANEPCACEMCGAICLSLKSLILHKITHQTKKKYPCRYCSEHFTRTNDRTHHEQKHRLPEDTDDTDMSPSCTEDGESTDED